MRDRDFLKEKNVQKEEMPLWIKDDKVYREKITRMLKSYVNPLVPSRHPETLFDIQSGHIAHKNLNAFNAFSIDKQMNAFE